MKLSLRLLALALMLCTASGAFAQDTFFKGKTVRIIVPFSAGGGYDVYSRIIGRHMGKYIPGNPVFVIENMTGAGGLIGINHVYKVSKPDGLTIGTPIGTMFIDQLIGKPGIEFDGRKFEYIGAPAQDTQLLIVHKRTGIKSVEQWLAHPTPVKFGSTGPGSANESIPKIAKEALNLPLQVVSGYKGSSVIRLAFNGGEVDGVANAWESMVSTWPEELRNGDAVILLQASGKRHPELANVPLVIDYAKTDMAKKLVRGVINNFGATARPYVVTPGTPKARVEILRKAFMDTMKDPEFGAELKKAKLDLNPLDGQTLENNIKELFALDKALIPKLTEILK
ncbi:MAG: tripartite tricarboxylate transporter substrate-binding protein [Candidatus Binatia bacterium]